MTMDRTPLGNGVGLSIDDFTSARRRQSPLMMSSTSGLIFSLRESVRTHKQERSTKNMSQNQLKKNEA